MLGQDSVPNFEEDQKKMSAWGNLTSLFYIYLQRFIKGNALRMKTQIRTLLLLNDDISSAVNQPLNV